MKRIFYIIFALVFIFWANLFAADTTNTAVNYIEYDDCIIYYGPTTFGSAAGTDNSITQAMFIGHANAAYGGIIVVFTDGTGTEDANGIIIYSNDKEADSGTWTTGTTYVGLDQIQVTVKQDTLGINSAADDPFKYSAWMALKFDGQTGNPNASVLNWYVYLRKNTNAPKKGAARVLSID